MTPASTATLLFLASFSLSVDANLAEDKGISGNCASLGQSWYYNQETETSPGCFSFYYWSATAEDVNADGEFSTFILTKMLDTCNYDCPGADIPCCDL